MASRKQVETLAQKLGCKFDVDLMSVSLTAPEGFAFNDQTYGQHYSDWPVGRGEDFTKQYAYDCCYNMLKGGVGLCDCNECASLPAHGCGHMQGRGAA